MPGGVGQNSFCTALVGVWTVMACLCACSSATAELPEKVNFNRDIRPLLSKNCFACHGSDEEHREAGLRLDRQTAATTRLENGRRAIVPGKPDESELFRRISAAKDDERMPPADSGKPLNDEQVALVRRWIEQGAAYAGHWSFTPPVRQPLPNVADPHWPRNGIDFFIESRLDRAGLQPSPRADRYALIRRLSLDLRGLPPTLAEVDAFVNDSSPDAYERVVDRYLSDPALGERCARVWLDQARYADSQGYQVDGPRTIWPYRDWVIKAFNDNLPFDQFTIEQLAGDLLPKPTQQQLIATAFNRNTMTNTEGGTDDEEFRVAAVQERIDTTMQVWMGLTMGCSKCHNHKYDPITQQEYYQFFAFFNQTADADLADDTPSIDVASPPELVHAHAIDARIASVKRQLAAAKDKDEKNSLQQQLDEQFRSRAQIPSVPVMLELPAEKRRKSFVLVKGNFLTHGDAVTADVPQSFHPFPSGAPVNRLGVALWLVDKHNTLTARVAVNRFWAQLFGTGLVETQEDFGTQGEAPSHPELLDWLAVEFMRHDWDQKAILRLMVTSETYLQSSRVTAQSLERDPQNRLLSRSPRYRLEAELVRDQALALSGLLSAKMFGPSVYPPQPAGLWLRTLGDRGITWVTSEGEDRYRRGLYTFWRRSAPHPSMTSMDAPSREVCTIRRIRTNTPLQAFVTLNDPMFVEAAQALARRIVKEGGSSISDRIAFALKLCLGHPPSKDQISALAELYRSELDHYRGIPGEATKMATNPLGPLPKGADAVELAAWTVVANALLNLDAVLTRG